MKMTFYSESFFGSDSDTGPAPFTKIALSGTDWHSTAQQPNSLVLLFSTDTDIYDKTTSKLV